MNSLSGSVLEEGIRRIPSCYSESLHQCLNATSWSDVYPDCEAIINAFGADPEAMEARLDQLPYCEERAGVMRGAAIGVLAATAAFVAAKILWGR